MERVFKDQMGFNLKLRNIPKRIISLVPSDTELLFDLGLGHKVVGVTDFCLYPKNKLKNINKIGGPKQINFSELDKLKPDFIIGNKEENYQEGIEYLKTKYPVWMSDIFTLEDALKQIKSLGEIFYQENRADNLIEEIKQNIPVTATSSRRKSVAYLIWNSPIMVAANQTFIDNLLSVAGYKNVFTNKERYPKIDIQELRQAKPDLIFLSSEPFPFSQEDQKEFQRLVPESEVRLVDGEMFSWYGSHLVQAMKYFKELI